MAGNLALGNGSTASNCGGTLTTAGYNLIESTTGCTLSGTAPGDLLNQPAWLGPLADNGGATPTHALLPISPAIEAGHPATPTSELAACEATDQRGLVRPEGPRCDIGAYETDNLPAVAWTQAAYSVDENQSGVTLTATLSAVSIYTVTVAYSTTSGTASSLDYTPLSGTLSFGPGQITATVALSLTADSLDESSETVLVALDAPHAASLGMPATATVTIVDDDDPPQVQFTQAAYTVTEPAVTRSITVELSAPSALTITVAYAASNGTASSADYTPISGTLSFAPSTTSAAFNLTLLPDSLDETDETVVLSLSNASQAALGSLNPATLTIEDDDDPPQVRFAQAAYTVTESAVTRAITVELSTASALTITVDYATSSGSASSADYTPVSGTLTFAPGTTTAVFNVSLTPDSFDEADETVTLALSNAAQATLGSPNPATLTIEDDDPAPTIAFTSSAYTATETAGTTVVSVTLSGPVAVTVTVDYAASPGTATSADFSLPGGTLSFAPGVLTQTVVISVTDDLIYEGDETLGLALSAPSNANLGTPATASLTIVDDDPAPTVQLTSAAYTATETAGTAVFTVTLSAAAGITVTVNYSTTPGTATAGADYLAAGGTLTFTPGVQVVTGTVTVLDDSLFEGGETLSLTLSNPANALLGSPATATITLISEDAFRIFMAVFIVKP